MPGPRVSAIRTVPYAPAGRSETYTIVRRHTLPPVRPGPCVTRKRETSYVPASPTTNGSGIRPSIAVLLADYPPVPPQVAPRPVVPPARSIIAMGRVISPPRPYPPA